MTAAPLLRAYARRPEATDSFWHMGALLTFLADGADTAGRFALKEFVVRRGSEPPRHTHSREDECFYILDGHFTFTVGEETLEAAPGSFVFLPRGLAHGFALHSETGRGLSLYTPAGIEEAFRELSEPAGALTLPPSPAGPPPDAVLARLIAVFRAYGVEFEPSEPIPSRHSEV